MNKDLFFEGKEYISASQASKKLGYAQDYIGELARSKKISGKLIGRTWYVEFESLLEHKKNRKDKKRKTLSTTQVGLNTKVASRTPLAYKVEIPRTLPKLTKSQKLTSRYERFVSGLVAVSISLIIVLNVLASWVAYLSPSVSDNINIKIADVSDSTAQNMTASAIGAESFASFLVDSAESKLAAIFGKNQPENLSSGTSVSPSTNGIVVVPDNARHADDVANIQGDFSDPVDVTFDQDGESGVITPDFRDPSTTDNYTFVMVPVAKTK